MTGRIAEAESRVNVKKNKVFGQGKGMPDFDDYFDCPEKLRGKRAVIKADYLKDLGRLILGEVVEILDARRERHPVLGADILKIRVRSIAWKNETEVDHTDLILCE